MFRFANIEYLWGLLIIPLFLIIFIAYKQWRKKSIKKIGDEDLVLKLIPNYTTAKPNARFVLFAIAYTLLIFGIANPQIGSKMEEVKREGVELMLCLDLSNSMKAEDLAPNRLERAKRAIAQLIDNLHSDKIGIVVFGGEAYVQLPLTTDYAAAKLFLNTIDTDIMPTQGTAIGNAIELATESFDMESPSGKSIVVITDGENHEDDAVEAAQSAFDLGITVNTIGMGSAQGSPIPIYQRGKKLGYRKDNEGSPIVTKLNEDMLKEIANAGNGAYIRATNSEVGLKHLMNEISKLDTAEFGTKVYTDYEDRFQYFIGFALLILIIESFISNSKSKLVEKLNLFGNKK